MTVLFLILYGLIILFIGIIIGTKDYKLLNDNYILVCNRLKDVQMENQRLIEELYRRKRK